MSEALKKELVSFGSHHTNAVNKLIHAVCVPFFLWTGMAMLAQFHVTTITHSSLTLDVTVTHIATLFYIIYYIYLHPTVGLITLPILSGMAYGAHEFWNLECENKMIWLAGIQMVTLLMQFIGHAMFEGERPAVDSSVPKGLLTAPFFLCFESCFFFGLFSDLHDEVQREVFETLQRKVE